MNNNLIALMTTALVADIVASEINDCSLEDGSVNLAKTLLDNDVDLDFVLVVACANKENLREVAKLAYEELARLQNEKEVERYVSSNNGNKK